MRYLAAAVFLIAIGFALASANEDELDIDIIVSDMPLENIVTAARQVH